MKMSDIDESVFSGKNFSKGDTVNTPEGKGTIQSIVDEDTIEDERTLTGHLGNDERVKKRAKVKLKSGETKYFSLFQLS